MNILIVSNFYPSREFPQFCIYIEQQAKALVQLGHRVEVIVPESGRHRKEGVRKYVRSGIAVHRHSYYSLYKEIYCSALLYYNIRTLKHSFDFSSYDIIAIHMFDENTLRLFYPIARKYRLKLVLHFHGLSILYDHPLSLPARLLQRRGDFVLKRLIAKADAIVGVSDKVGKRVREYCPNKHIFTVYNGADTHIFRPADAKDRDFFTIVCVAGLKRIKGIHYLISAVKLLGKKHPDIPIRLILIGKGAEETALKNQVKFLHLEDMVRFMGLIPYEEVADILRQGDVFALPSFYEALGCAYLEAMACRLPVIGCKYQGIDEIICHGQNGLLVEPHNVKELWEKLDYLLMNPDKAREIAEEGLHTIINGYTWEASAIRLSEVYRYIGTL